MCHLQELYAKYKNKGLVVLGLDPADDKKIGLGLLRENGVTFPNIIEDSKAANRVANQDYPLAAWPTSYIIGRDGKVVDVWIGYDEGEPRAMAALQKASPELGEAIRQEMKAKAARASPEVATAAQRLFQAIRAADYNHDWISTKDWEHFPAKDVDYTVDHNYPGWVRWVCRKFKADPIADVRLGKVSAGPDGSPTVHFELRLKDGEVLQGDLPFHWDSERKQWIGWEGLDWHLHAPPGKETKKP
jgi:hypothetical protein